MTKYTVDKAFSCRTERSDRVLEVAESFGIGLEEREFKVLDNVEVDIDKGDVVYITGQSGSGKSQMLNELERLMREEGLSVVNMSEVKYEDKPIIDQVGSSTSEAIELLSRAGINDAYILIRKPQELSDGQMYRFKLATIFSMNADVIVCDEFAAVLDRVTAKVVSYAASNWVRKKNKILIVATTHTDLITELAPTITIVKRFNDRIEIVTEDAIDASNEKTS